MVHTNVIFYRSGKFRLPSAGYLDIYYQKVTFELVDGVGTLNKTYGPWHSIYLYYLIIYFSIIVGIIVYSFLNHKNTPVSELKPSVS